MPRPSAKRLPLSISASILAAFLVAWASPGPAQVYAERTAAGCIDLADPNTRVVATGRLDEATFSGPYGSETALVLELPRPICIDDAGQFADPGQQFSHVHIGATSEALLKALHSAIRRKLCVSGEGFAAHTSHHHAPLVVIADKILVR